MKIKHIHIDEYKVFRDFDIDFCLDGKPQNLIVVTGVNGNGKTTLFRDVISGIDAATKPQSTVIIENDKGVDTFFFPMHPVTELFVENFSKIRLYEAGNNSSVEQFRKEIVGYVDKIVYEKGKTSFDAYAEIQHMIDDILLGFNLQIRFKSLNREKQLIFVNSRNEEFGIEGLSNGELQVLSKIFVLFTDDLKGCVVLIDEPESSLHPSWQLNVLPVLRHCAEMNDCQIIVATQSPQIIASAHREEIRFFVRDNEGYVRAKLCESSPYGWTVEKVLSQIQGVRQARVSEIEDKIAGLKELVKENKYESDEFKEKLSELEGVLGYTDQDLVLIRMEVIRRKKRA